MLPPTAISGVYSHFYHSINIFTMIIQQTIPNTLRAHRKQAGLRQLDVAYKLGFKTTDRISQWENGLNFPHMVNLFKLSALYKVPPQELYRELFQMVGSQVDQLPAGDTSLSVSL
jgi:transcriptional regulator with XRE-family HTH domain